MSSQDIPVETEADAAFSSADWQAATIRATFWDAGFDTVEPPVLQPAEIFLNRSGEDIRRRMYVFTDPGGDEVCLRPDLTIPTCRLYLENNPKASGATKLSYFGQAFRYQSEGSTRPKEFWEAGVESLGVRDRERADADVLDLILRACENSGLEDYSITIGDVGLFFALIEALDIPDAWRRRLRWSLWHTEEFDALIKRYSSKKASSEGALLKALSDLDEGQARAALEDVMDLAQISPVGGRSMEEIADRLLAQAAETRAEALPKDIVKLVGAYRKVKGKPKTALKKIRELTKKAKVNITPTLEKFEKRLSLLEKKGIDTSKLTFDADFGRNMEYYTGFVFEISVENGEGAEQIAGGGRYDTLLKELGAAKDVPAVGGSIRTERLLATIEAQNKGGAS